LGFNVLPNTSRVITEWALRGFKDTPERALDIIDSMMDMFNPIGNAGLSYQSISPTMFDPLVALSENRDWTGKPIRREDMSALDPSPGYTRTRDSASWIGEQLAYYLNLASGGTDATKGIVSPTGDDIDYLVGQLTGGVGREALKLTKTGQAIVEGEELPSYNVPLFGRFYGDVRGMAATSSAFYRNVTNMNGHKREIDDLREKRGNLGEYLRKNPDARLYKMAGKQYREIQKLREARRMALERGNKQQAKTIENTIKARMEQFNKRVEEAEKR